MTGSFAQRARWLAAAFSLLVHVGVASVIGRSTVPVGGPNTGISPGNSTLLVFNDEGWVPPPGTIDPPPPPQATDPIPEQDPERPLVLGIDQSGQKTENWLGSDTPTEHSADKSSVNQPALDPEAGAPAAGGAAGTPGAPQPSATQGSAQATPSNPDAIVKAGGGGGGGGTPAPAKKIGAKTDASERLLAGPEVTVPDLPGDPDQPTPRKPEGPEAGGMDERTREAADEQLREPQEGVDSGIDRLAKDTKHSDASTIEPADFVGPPTLASTVAKMIAAAEALAEQQRATSAPSESSSASASGSGASGPGGQPGERPGAKSDKESDAASIEQMLVIRPGMPAAAEGLEIITRRPNFTRLTRVTSLPGNPILRIVFRRDGRVRLAEVLRSSGSEDVDGPVLNAVYNWQAKGKVLDALPKTPSAEISLTVTIVLR